MTVSTSSYHRAPVVDLPCRTSSPDLWFAERTADVEAAKALCGPCPVKADCLTSALARAEPWGVWGGEVLVGGVVVATKRGRGRPRKQPVPVVPVPVVPVPLPAQRRPSP